MKTRPRIDQTDAQICALPVSENIEPAKTIKKTTPVSPRIPVELTNSAWMKLGLRPFERMFLVREMKLPSVRPDMIGITIKLNTSAARATSAKIVVNASRIATEKRKAKIGPRLTTKFTNQAIRRAFGEAISKFSGSPAGAILTFAGLAALTFAATGVTAFATGFAFATALATGFAFATALATGFAFAAGLAFVPASFALSSNPIYSHPHYSW